VLPESGEHDYIESCRDDHELSDGLRLALEDVDYVSIVGEAASAQERRWLSAKPAARYRDHGYPHADGSGIDACREIVARCLKPG